MTRPSRRGRNRAFLTGETGTGTPSGDDKSWDAGPYTPPGGVLTDHTHAATGSGPTGGGASLAPTTLILPQGTTPAQTAEGSAVWDTDDDKLTIGTGAARKTMVNEGAITGSGLTQATARLLGRTTASTGAIEEITVGSGLSLSAGALTATGGGTTITTKDEGSTLSSTVTTLDFVGAGVTATGGGATTTITIPGGGGGLTKSFVGYNTVGGSNQAMTGVRVYCKKVSLTAGDLVVGISAYVRNTTDALSAVVASVLDDNSNAPGKLLAFGGGNTTIYLSTSASMPSAYRWLHVAVGFTAPSTADYWITFAQSGGSGMDIANDGSGSDQYFTPSGFYATSAYPSAWAITTTTQKFSIRASVVT